MGSKSNSHDVFLSKSKEAAGDDISSFNDDEDDEMCNEREHWPNKREFILSIVGFCVGLGNLWRFPYVCMKNGGGAFLIPFIIALIVCGMPTFFMESALGQFMGKSSFHVFSFCPLLKGVGISTVILCGICNLYYSMILGWSLIYLVNSFKSPLPWTLCDQSWNTENCVTPQGRVRGNDSMAWTDKSTNYSVTLPRNESAILTSAINESAILTSAINESAVLTGAINNNSVSSTEEFWLHNVLEVSSGLDDIGGLPWHTAVSLIVANLLVLIGIVKGIKSSGKVVYVSATLPYVLLIVFFILGLTLEGAGDGVLYYIKPDFSKLMTITPWMEAAIQVFYSLGPGWGGIITMASYNKFKNNCMRDAILLTLCCEGTSIFGGFVVFMILGHMAYKTGVHISKFAKSGGGLVFVVYPEAIYYLPLPQLWGFLFFLMLFSLGLDSMFTTVETIVTVIADVKPKFVHKWRILISMATLAFFTSVGLIYATRGGIYWFQLTDWYIAAFSLILQGAIECLAISWIYGSDRFARDIELMIGRKPYAIFLWAWKSFTPAILLTIWCLTLAFYKPPTYEGYIYPRYAEVIGWLIAVAPFMAVVIYAVYEVLRHRGSLTQRLRLSCTPSKDWMPASLEARKKYQTIPLDDYCHSPDTYA